jgi:hypothetical protein
MLDKRMNFARIASRVASLSMPLSDRNDYGSSGPSVPRGDELESRVSYVKKTPDKEEWCVKSESNPDWSGGCYPSKTQAEGRLSQVEMFKNMKRKKPSKSVRP